MLKLKVFFYFSQEKHKRNEIKESRKTKHKINEFLIKPALLAQKFPLHLVFLLNSFNLFSVAKMTIFQFKRFFKKINVTLVINFGCRIGSDTINQISINGKFEKIKLNDDLKYSQI